jgi:choline dehydrogenase-like flavoprotein
MAIMIEAFKLSQYMFSLSPWQDLQAKPFGALGSATTDAQIEAVIRDTITTFWHVSCTAKMGLSSDPMAVLDSKLNVKGVTGVRVVDASVFVSLSYLLFLHGVLY